MQIGIIGCGSVGASTAFSLIYSNKVDVLKIYNRNQNKLKGMVMDLEDAGYINKTVVLASDISNMLDCDYIIITTGKKQKKGEKRTSLFKENFNIINHYMKLLANYKKTIILVTNPVDKITNKLRELYPYINIISTSIAIDKVRLYQLTQDKGKVIGTHDSDKRVVLKNRMDITLSEIVSKKADEIIYYKGETCYGISAVIKEMIENETK